MCNPRLSDIGFAMQIMMLKQFHFIDSFLSCLKAMAMDKGKQAFIAGCFS